MLYELINAICRARSEYIRRYYYEPEVTVTFSPEGFNNVRACTDAQRYLSNPNVSPDTIYGCSFLVDPHQPEDFKVYVRDKCDRRLHAIICGSPKLVNARSFK